MKSVIKKKLINYNILQNDKIIYNKEMNLEYKKIEKIIKSFANHRRIQILELLGNKQGLSVDNIAKELNVGFFTISDHIRKLSDSGLVEKKNKGRFVINNITKKGNYILSFCKMFK
jgi:CRISPR locus-related DNA-binding protein